MRNFLAMATCLLIVVPTLSCNTTKVVSLDSYGDGLIDPGEECDGDVGEFTCASLGHYRQGGTLTCRPGCLFDRSDCGGRCGDGEVNPEGGEDCDRTDLAGRSCQGEGFGGGTLACNLECTLDLSGCTTACGNGEIEGAEACDDGGRGDGDGCSATCEVEEGWTCDLDNPTTCRAVCGDGLVVGEETCDGPFPAGLSCIGLGYHGGMLACTGDCRLDLAGCETAGRCGDGLLQADAGEVCDGAVPEGRTCAALGYHGGTLACAGDCLGFDTTSCEAAGTCGDNTLQALHGEVCDHLNLNGQSCASLGFHAGELACAPDCTGFDASDCELHGRCGDSVVQAGYGELCDGDSLGGSTCQNRGWYSGTLACNAACSAFVETGCTGRCGDGVRQPDAGEACDRFDLGGATCRSRGYYGGTLACNAACTALDESSCQSAGRCGDSVIQAERGEACDGANLGGATCQARGYYGGELACDATCAGFVEDNCISVGRCGDGVVQTSWGEVCDGAALGGTSCVSMGYYGGELACNDTCSGFVEAGCVAAGRCGDGVRQAAAGEVCDGVALGGATCVSRGWYGGTLTCNTGCSAFDESACLSVGRCGDSTVQAAFGEVCDTANLDGNTCASLGFYGGPLACTADCRTFDTAACVAVGRCGDGVIQETWAEVCDGENLRGLTCEALGFHGGALACAADCRSLNQAPCVAVGRCGDGLIQDTWGEACDGANLDEQTCLSLGYYGGSLTCDPDCGALNLSACVSAGRCGDEVVHTAQGEQCDGGNLNDQTCVLQGRYPGVLSCDGTCRLELTACGGLCGDGEAQTQWGEACDGSDHDGKTCQTYGFYAGSLACDGTCGLDASGCNLFCGDGLVQTDHGETCDGANLAGQTCESIGYRPGVLACDACGFNVSGCGGRCGDGIAQTAAGEVCDGADLVGESCTSLDPDVFGGTLACDAACAFTLTGCAEVLAVTSGGAHTCALLTDGSVKCWGDNTYGQLGIGSLVSNSPTPVLVGTLGPAIAVDAGDRHTCAILTDGTVRCWGLNDYGQLGDGTTVSSLYPVNVGSTEMVAVSAGSRHTCALRSDGTARCWGAGALGQLGNGQFNDRYSPVVVSWLSGATALTAGGNHNCAILSDGTLKCWGWNNYGQLGLSTTDNRNLPYTVHDLSGVLAVAAGGQHTCVALAIGMKCWGRGDSGQLGNNSVTSSTVPMDVVGPVVAVGISAGNAHNCSLLADGTMKCWGDNDYGQLGNNSVTFAFAPVSVTGMTTGAFISAGAEQTCAVLTDGKLQCWGRNQSGQLGDGSTTNRLVPTYVVP